MSERARKLSIKIRSIGFVYDQTASIASTKSVEQRTKGKKKVKVLTTYSKIQTEL